MQKRPCARRLWALLGLVLQASAGHAQQADGLRVSGGITGVLLDAGNSGIATDRTLSADLDLERRMGNGRWLVYIEANSSLDQDAVSTRLPESNADAGTALDPDRDGRVQISGLNYSFMRKRARLTAGLIDPSAYLDRSRITNDENVQFLGVAFVNNPTIEFPDYTLGFAYERQAQESMPQINVVVASSHGLADNPNLSYSQLIQVTEDDKGLFAAMGAGWVRERSLLRLGVWLNSRDHRTLDGSRRDAGNYGAFAVLGRSWGRHGLNARLGLARPDVTQGSGFIALAYRLRWREHAVGAGMARTILSDDERDPALDDSSQFEIYARLATGPQSHITISMQRLRHSGFSAAASEPGRSATVAGLRFRYAF